MSRYFVRLVDISALPCLNGEPSTYKRELHRVVNLLDALGLSLSTAKGAGGLLFFLQYDEARQ